MTKPQSELQEALIALQLMVIQHCESCNKKEDDGNLKYIEPILTAHSMALNVLEKHGRAEVKRKQKAKNRLTDCR